MVSSATSGSARKATTADIPAELTSMANLLKVGPPWSDELHATRDAIILDRERLKEERVSRPSVAEWYAGRSVLVTGASGFMGRVLVEFLLRCCPDVGRVYVVLRAKRGVPVQERLPALLDVPLFDRLRREQPDALRKVVAVAGDVEAASSLGLSAEDRVRVCAEVSVVFHMAASVRFDDPFQKAVFTNLRSAREVVALARDMPQLKVLVHVSTAYCNIKYDPLEERVYPTDLDWREVIRWAEQLPDADQAAVDFLGDKLRGFQPNTYTLTKALAERLMEDAARDLPVIITRPSVVVGSYTDPLPGWMDNINGLCGITAGGAMGILRVSTGPCRFFDSLPVDVATKIIILASWAKALGIEISSESQTETVDVVNVTAGPNFNVSFDDFLLGTRVARHNVIFPGCVRLPEFTYESSGVVHAAKVVYHHLVFGLVLDLLARATGAKPRAMSIYRKATNALTHTAPFMRVAPILFVMDNQRRLQTLMHPGDERTLDFLEIYSYRDSVDTWLNASVDNLRGILLYVFKEKDDPEAGRRRINRLRWIGRAYNTAAALLGLALIRGVCCLVLS